MKTLTILMVLATTSMMAQKNTVKIDFKEPVNIQDLSKPYKWNTYEAVIYQGEGILKFDVYCSEQPMHLIVHTYDNESYNLLIAPACDKVKLEPIEWEREDLAIDLSKLTEQL